MIATAARSHGLHLPPHAPTANPSQMKFTMPSLHLHPFSLQTPPNGALPSLRTNPSHRALPSNRANPILIPILSLILLLCSVLIPAQGVHAQPKGTALIRNATVVTITGEDLAETDILIRDGIITQIGKGLKAPSGVRVIDATGKTVMPGIIDAHSHLNAIGINEGTNPVTSEVTMVESIDPNDVSIYRALAGGVTAINLMHGSANVIGGRNATLKLRYGRSQEEMRFQDAPQTIKFALGENPMRTHGEGSRIQPATRMGVEQVIRDHFDAAKDYRRARNAYLSAKAAYDRRPRGVPPVPVAKNLRLEVLADILDGKILVHCHSYRSDEILMLVRVFNDYGVRNYTFQHANEAFKVAPELARHGAMASIFADWWAYKFEVYYSTPYNAAILQRNGVVTSINSDSDELIRHLNHEAAKAVRYGGVTRNEALRMITLNPALQLGVGDRVGSIEVGKQADLSIWSGDPLSMYSINEMTLVDGVVYFDRASDPDDMRLDAIVSPSVRFEDTQRTFYQISGSRHEDSCMADTFTLFKEGEFSGAEAWSDAFEAGTGASSAGSAASSARTSSTSNRASSTHSHQH